MTDLPGIYAPVECDHCFTSLDWDEGFTCHQCGLYWPDPNPYSEVEPEFLDDDAQPCGHSNGGNERTHDGARFWDGTCTLPEGHKSQHRHPTRLERLIEPAPAPTESEGTP